MSNSKKELQTIRVSELTLFGGLAKVLIPQQTGAGVSKITDTHLRWKMTYLNLKLKKFKLERIKDFYTGEWHDVERIYSIIDVKEGTLESSQASIPWRDTIWTFAIFRSLDIWKRLTNEKLESSLGGLYALSKKSLNGKLGMGNGRYFQKGENGEWHYLKFKPHYQYRIFRPLTQEAVNKCRVRAQALAKLKKYQ